MCGKLSRYVNTLFVVRPPKKLQFLVSACFASDQRISIFRSLLFFCSETMSKIAGSIGILPRCVLNDFFT